MMNFMGKQIRVKHSILALAGLLVLFALSACASNPATANCPVTNRVNQSFSYDIFENPNIEVLDYFYGTPNCPSLYSNDDQKRRDGRKLVSISMTGVQYVAQKLYVKWRVNSTGQVLEDTVDLRQRLPKDMTKHRLHFIVRDTGLFVFVVKPEFREKGTPPDDGPIYYKDFKILTIYPDQPK